MELTKDEVLVREELAKIYPQLIVNARKTAGYGFSKHGMDVLSVAIEYFLNKPIEVQLKSIRDNKMENFITFMMAMQLKSNSSHYHYHYRRWDLGQREIYFNYDYGEDYIIHPEDIEETSLCVQCIKDEIEQLDVYSKMLVNEHLINKKNFSQISKKYKISYTNLKKDTIAVAEQIREKCKKFL